jgi:NADPH2:quinone reductase
MQVVEMPLQKLGPGEVCVRQTAIGVNFHDLYVRSGLYRTLQLPGVLGVEAAGVVEAIGDQVSEFRVGDRIGYVCSAYGAYSEVRNLPAALAVHLPAWLTDAQAAATWMKALTACMLVRHVHHVTFGETVLVQAAAGGVGQLLCSWAHYLGATVLGTVGSQEKSFIARRAGADHTFSYCHDDVAARSMELTDGAGVAAVYDSVGADTFDGSLASLAYCGHLVSFGQSSGPVASFAPSQLATRSLSLTRPIIFHYLRTPTALRAMADETLGAFHSGALRVIEPIQLPLEGAADAHRMLEARQSPGGIVLVP